MAHYYSKEGRVKDVPNKSRGGMREPNLRDARRLDLAPGVTDVMSVMAKPALETWKVKQGILAAQKLDPDDYLTEEAFVKDALAQSKEEAITKANIGTEIHGDIERAMRGEDHGNFDIVKAVKEILTERYPNERFDPEQEIFGSIDGLNFGGTVDLLGQGVIVDVKTKDVLQDKMVWDEHLIQLAMYRYAVEDDWAMKCANLFVSYDGDVELIEHTEEQLQRGLAIGTACVKLWYAMKW